MRAPDGASRRCAVYTRKSSEEGLEQEFNSLHAQREACEAFIRSQKSEGWQLVATLYDDGGISGGTMERPALQALLADIAAGRIDTVVVYKVDRLTRSLADFAKMVEVFDAHGVSFVAVTQQFNTTTSMGRLTLNILLSFAQFEREVTGERIRDKIAASKRKGIWMGGNVPLGYRVEDRKLIVVPEEAEIVQLIFERYVALGSVRELLAELAKRGLRSRSKAASKPYGRGALYCMLSNPIYIGRIRHKGVSHPGQHEGIVPPSLWEEVQSRLAENGPEQSRTLRVSPSPLVGRLFDEADRRLTPSHAVKDGRRYRYYVSQGLVDGSRASEPTWRLPAPDLERLVAGIAADALADEHALIEAVLDAQRELGRLEAVFAWAAVQMAALRSPGRYEALKRLVQRVVLTRDGITVTVSLDQHGSTLTRHVPLRLKRRGVETRLVIAGAQAPANADSSMVKALSRAARWSAELFGGQVASAAALAAREGLTVRYISKVIRLAFLSPEIVEAILAGTQPVELTADRLIQALELPLDWAEQKAALGFV